jgi:uncharacterized RDD family membrane protein YckC
MTYGYGAPRDPTDVVGRRIFAYVIDILLTLIGFVTVLSLAHYEHRTGAPGDACAILRAQSAPISGAAFHATCISIGSHVWLWKRGDFLTAVGVAALIAILNIVVLQAVTGASIGKHALGLQVVDDKGKSAGFGRVVVRSLLLVVDGVIVLIGLVSVLVTHFHRRIGDFAAGTFVVGKSSVGSPVGVTSGAVPYGGAAFAAPGLDPGMGNVHLPPAPLAPDPGWAVPRTPAPPAGSQWSAPPAPLAPTAPPPAPRVEPVSPVPAPPPVPVAPTPAQPTVPESAPAHERLPDPEAWWDTAIGADPPASEEQP